MSATGTRTIVDLDTYGLMYRIRRFEERCLDLRKRDEIAGSIHLCIGQEAVPAGALAALGDDDRVVATYRGHGWALACGVPMTELLAEICQRATGVNGGRGGSPYLSAPQYGFLGENSVVAAGLPVAVGAAMAAQAQGGERVVVVSFGDGATSQGGGHEAMVFAVARRLPVVFVCENNDWSEMTAIAAISPVSDLATRAAGYGMPGVTIDGNDPSAVHAAIEEATARARAGDGPSFVEAKCVRLAGHYNADVEHYRTAEDRAADAERDPLPRLRNALLACDVGEAEIDRVHREVDAEVEQAVADVLAAPRPDPATAAEHVVGTAPRLPDAGRRDVVEPAGSPLTFAKAVNEALRRELSDRPEMVLYGEDVALPGGVFGVTRDLHAAFGGGRVFDTPIAETAMLGAAVGAATEGLRPVVEIMWADFLLVALDPLVNTAANVRYLSRGEVTAPLVVRCQQGVTPGSCAQHSQSLEALLAHVPGLRIGQPGTPQDAYAMLRAAISDDDPTILFESRAIYQRKGAVDLDAPVEPIGGARLRRTGSDLAIITWGRIQHDVLLAADRLAEEGIDASVLDLRWLAPLDLEAIAAAVGQSHRVLVVHEANVTGGFGAEIVAGICERHLYELDAAPVRLGSPDVRFPSAPVLQAALVPDVDAIVAAGNRVLNA